MSSSDCSIVCAYRGISKYEGVSNVVDLHDDIQDQAFVHGLRIKPSALSYQDTYVGQVYVKRIGFQNVCNHKIILRVLKPFSLAFKVTDDGKWTFLPPGMSFATKVIYRCSQNKDLKSVLPILINDFKHEILIEVHKGEARVRVYPLKLDFGVLDVGCPFVSKSLCLDNAGVCPTLFSIDFMPSELELVAIPKAGRIQASSRKIVKIEMTCFTPGEYCEEVWVRTVPPYRIIIDVVFIMPYLKALHPLTTGDFTLIDFLPTIQGTERYETLIVRNVSSKPTTYAVLTEIDCKTMTLELAKKSSENYSFFNVEPLEGIIGPFEGRIFTVMFSPQRIRDGKGWEHKGDMNLREYLAFIKIVKVEVLENQKQEIQVIKKGGQQTLNDDDLSTSDEDQTNEMPTFQKTACDEPIILRLCLHGISIKPTLEVTPDCISFPSMSTGSENTKVLSIRNNNETVTIGYRFSKIPYLFVEPPCKFLKPNQRVEVLVKLIAQSLGSRQKVLTLDLVSQKNVTDNKNVVKVGEINVKLEIKIKASTKELKPAFNLGITPAVKHEVGVNSELMTFKKKLKGEKAPILMPSKKKKNRPWLKSNFVIAFPNDRPLSLAPKPFDNRMLTPFTGTPRYIPPACKDYTYTEEELMLIKKHQEEYNKIASKVGDEQRKALMDIDRFVNDFSYTLDKRLFNKADMFDDIVETVLDEKCKPSVNYNDLCPLTPMDLFNINVEPRIVDFGMIPSNVNVTKSILVSNLNKFPVAIQLIIQKPSVKIPDSAFVVPAESEVSKEIIINLATPGKHFSNMNYVINRNHVFHMKVTAEVVGRTLEVYPQNVVFQDSSVGNIYQIRFVVIRLKNPLSVPTSFIWKIGSNSPYTVNPMRGTISGQCELNCTVTNNYKAESFFPATIHLSIIQGPHLPIQCTYVDNSRKVCLLNPKIFCPNISVCLPHHEDLLLFNPAFRDNLYRVVHPIPSEGVTISPKSGVIRARSCLLLQLTINLNKVTCFSFKVFIEINSKYQLEFKVNGSVIYPQVTFKPSRIFFRNIACFSFDTASVVAFNESEATALIKFAMKDYFQIKVSTSQFIRDLGLSSSEGISLPPHSCLKIYFHFLPKELASLGFNLPIILNNLIGPPDDNRDSLLTDRYIKFDKKSMIGSLLYLPDVPKTINTVKIDCTIDKGLIMFSDMDITFIKDSVDEGMHLLKVKNLTDENIIFYFDSTKFHHSPFEIRRNDEIFDKFYLDPEEEITLHIYFKPLHKRTYTTELPVYVQYRKETMLYNVLQFTGIIRKSSLYCADHLMYFIPVPLNITAKKSTEIVANHQTSPTAISYTIYALNGDKVDEAVWCEYPQGNHIPGTNEPMTIPVTINFRSNSSFSAIVIISFSDGLQGECKVALCVTAENCLLTTHVYTFLSSYYPNLEDTSVDLLQELSEEKSDVEGSLEYTSSTSLLEPNVSRSSKILTPSIKKSTIVEEPSKTNWSLMEEYDTVAGKLRSSGIFASDIQMRLSQKSKKNGFEEDLRFDLENDVESDPELTTKNKLVVEDLEQPNDNHNRILMEINEYPMFPSSTSDTVYAKYLRGMLEFLEMWMYEQGFQCSFRMRMGVDVFYSKSFQKALFSRSKTVHHSEVKSIIFLLRKLVGSDFDVLYSMAGPSPEDDVGRVYHILKIYKQILLFLRTQGALMEHVLPHYLLTYPDYVIYYNEIRSSYDPSLESDVKRIMDSKVLLEKDFFVRISLHCWVDLILQIFKVLILIPISFIPTNNKTNMFDNRTNAPYSFDGKNINEVGFPKSSYGKIEDISSMLKTCTGYDEPGTNSSENILLKWLNFIFEAKRSSWNNKYPTLMLPRRKIANFTTDLEDGVVLTAVTTYFCPYLTKEFHHFYFKPTNKVEFYHNTILLASIWNKIRLGISVLPEHFCDSNQVNMIIIVTHLFLYLRTYIPRDTVKMNTCLSSVVKRRMTLFNPSLSKIKFALIKIGDPNDYFNICTDKLIVIPPGDSVHIAVQYEAKKLYRVHCVLMFCGASHAGNFADNIVFELEGEPSSFELKDHYCISIPIYKTTFLKIRCSSPYIEEAIYELWCAEQEPKPGNMTIIYNWKQIKDRKIPRVLYLGCTELAVPSVNATPAILPVVITCFSMTVCNLWLIFTNPKTGDFIIKLTLTPRYDYEHAVLCTTLPLLDCVGILTLLCTASCPRLVHIAIPSKNYRFWESVKTMMFFTLNEKEKQFWSEFLETTTGLNLMKWLLGEEDSYTTKQFSNIFETKVTYTLEVESDLVEVPPTVTIPDTRVKSTIDIPLHVRTTVNGNFCTRLIMKSVDKTEVRVYKIIFIVADL